MSKGWIGVDLDGTLAVYDVWRGPDHIGEPIPLMVKRVKRWVEQGCDVRIFTARVCQDNSTAEIAREAINKWQAEHLGFVLPVTSDKDYRIINPTAKAGGS